MKNETFSVPGPCIFSAFAISIFQFAYVAPHFSVIKVPRNLSIHGKLIMSLETENNVGTQIRHTERFIFHSIWFVNESTIFLSVNTMSGILK